MKYKQALLLYHMAAREEIINQMMREALIEADIVSEVIIAEAYEAISHIYDYHPDIIVSFLPRDEYSSALFTMVKMYYQCIWIAIPTEGFMELSSKQMRLFIGRNRQPKTLIDYYWFWGRGMADAAKKVLFESKKVTSADRIGVFGYLPYEKEKILQFRSATNAVENVLNKAKKYQKTVLVVTAMMSRTITVEEMIIESTVNPKNKDEVEDAERLVLSQSWYADRYVEAISEMAGKLRDCLFIIKTHPAEKSYLDYYNDGNSRYDMWKEHDNIVLVKEPIPISVLLINADCLVHYGSTTAMEAYVYGIPSIGLKNTYKPEHKKALGTAYLYGTQIVDVIDQGCLCETIKKAVFSRDDVLEQALFDYMNYLYHEPYHPSELLTKLFRQITEAQGITIKDCDVRSRIWNKYCVYRRMVFLYEAVSVFLKGDAESAKKRIVWLCNFWRSCIRSVSLKSVEE